LDKLDLIIREKQAELQSLQAELHEALTGVKLPGIELPDYETAGRLQPVLYGLMTEIERLEKLRIVQPATQDFQTYLSRLLTDDTVSTLELWTQIRDYWSDTTIRLLEIRKGKTGHRISCMLRLGEPTEPHLYSEHTAKLQHIGWKAGRGKRTFYFKTRLRSPDTFDAFCQIMSVTMLEALSSLWQLGQQYYCFK
jgi:hypothetical protein